MSTTDVVRIPPPQQQQQQQGSSVDEEQGRLKNDLQYLRRRGLLKAPGELSYQGRKCARCCAPFGRFYNTGTTCTRCRYRVCRQCRIEVRGPNEENESGKDVEWICNVCYKIAELHVITGKWMYEDPFPREIIDEKKTSPVDILKHSIRRAWTINGPPTRWSAARKSPELRVYRSLPTRRQEYRESLENNGGVTENLSSLRSEEESRSIERAVEEDKNEESPSSLEKIASRTDISGNYDRTKRGEKARDIRLDEEVPSADVIKSPFRRNEKNAVTGNSCNKAKEGQEETIGNQEQCSTPRVSLLKPPRILSKLISSPDIKLSQSKHGERKSNIPIFKRSSKEFEDIRSPQESPKRSLIPQRYRGSTDDLRRSREDISVPSLIPKLLSPRNKEERLKRQDSKDDVRVVVPKSTLRKDSKEETKINAAVSQTIGNSNNNISNSSGTSGNSVKEESKTGIRIFRRDSREDVGRESSTNSNASVATKGKQTGKEVGVKEERTEERVGELTASKSKSIACEQSKRKSSYREQKETFEDGSVVTRRQPFEDRNLNEGQQKRVDEDTMLSVVEKSENEERPPPRLDANEGKEIQRTMDNGFREVAMLTEEEEEDKSVKDNHSSDVPLNGNDIDIVSDNIQDRRSFGEVGHGRKMEEFQVVRRKFSKEEFSNPDDTDDTPNKRCSSHLSPEASPLSTRSSRYSPRESESEPTPALPRKIGGDSCSASQRIRDAITRTRRESNSSARYESSGSESVRLSETGLHDCTDITRKVKFFGGNGSGAIPLIIGNDEVVQRDSATSAGEDEPHEDGHSNRIGPVSSQGRSMLRRRRQFDAQGSRRRGRSHARTCCGEDLQSLQALHVIGRGDRQESPTGSSNNNNNNNNHGQDQPIVDYRRLVFISSDSSSGREEDDADSSCSSSSYLNGLPRGGGHAQSLEDCDWDYFESGSLPLPHSVPVTIGTSNVGTDANVTQDWSCCPGRGSSACQACGGSGGANVLPVPVPIPVPVPYPVPVPAALWTSDFAAAASSMISRAGDSEPGTLRLRGDPGAPWFAWHPRFNQPLHRGRLDPRLTSIFDPANCVFRPEQVIVPELYESPVETSVPATSASIRDRLGCVSTGEAAPTSRKDDATNASTQKLEDNFKNEKLPTKELVESIAEETAKTEDSSLVQVEKNGQIESRMEENEEEAVCEDSLSSSFESGGQMMYQRSSHEDSGSSSGRSSADSSDLEDDSSSHRFSRVFVVNDDSLTSDNDIEDNGEEDDSDSANEGGVTLKRVTALPDEEPVILQHVRLLNEDGEFEDINGNQTGRNRTEEGESQSRKVNNSNGASNSDKKRSRNGHDRSEAEDERMPLLLEHRLIPEEIYLADESESLGNKIELKSVRALDPDSIDTATNAGAADEASSTKTQTDYEPIVKLNPISKSERTTEINRLSESSNVEYDMENELSRSSENWDSTIIPDSLEISEEVANDSSTRETFEDFKKVAHADFRVSTPSQKEEEEEEEEGVTSSNDNDDCESRPDKRHFLSESVNDEMSDRKKDNLVLGESRESSQNFIANSFLSSAESSTGNETTTTGSEVSSDELHEYEVTPFSDSNATTIISAVNEQLLHGRAKFENTLESIQDEVGSESRESIDDKSLRNNSSTKSLSSSQKTLDDPSSSVSEKKDEKDDEEDAKEVRKNVTDEEVRDVKDIARKSASREVGDMVSSRIQEIFMNAERAGGTETAHEVGSFTVRGESPVSNEVVGNAVGGSGSGCDVGGGGGGAGGEGGSGKCDDGGGESTEGVSTRFRSVERRPSTRKENGFPPAASTKDSTRNTAQYFPSSAVPSGNTSNSSNNNNNNANRYRSLVMITQEASYQPVSVITSDTTTLLQPDEVHSPGQGLAGYFQLALETVAEQPHRKAGQPPRRPLMVSRLQTITTNHSETEVDSGLSVGSASESDDVSVKNASKINNRLENSNEECQPKERQSVDHREGLRARASSQSSDDNSANGGLVILEEGLADDDSWVEEVSHDEDEPGATTATEESSEDEANNLGDREEELRGYHRQAIDFTLHTIVEESCEESEAEPSLATGSPTKKQRPPSASELEKYFFFGLGGDGNNSSMGSREVDSLSETSSIYSEGLESLGQDEPTTTANNANNGQNQERFNSSEGFLNSSRLEKYFLSEFLGFDQDRRDSDGSVGSDSEGRPSPEAQRRKRLVRARGTGRSHSSSLDNLLALTQSSQNLSSQNSLQDLSLNQDLQETQSEGSSTETDGAEDGQTAAFGTDGQFDTVKRKKKKPRNLGTQSPRVPDDRNKTPEPNREMMLMGEVVVEDDTEAANSEDSDRAKTPQPEGVLSSSSSPSMITNTSAIPSPQVDSSRSMLSTSADSISYSQRSKQQSRDSGFVGSCDDLLQHQKMPDDVQANSEVNQEAGKDRTRKESNASIRTADEATTNEAIIDNEKSNLIKIDHPINHTSLPHLPNASLSRKDSFNNWSSDEETNLMMSKMRQFFKTMVANSNGQTPNVTNANSSGASPAPSPRLPGYSSKTRMCPPNRTKPPQLVYFENELTRLMKTVPGIRDEQVREIVEYLSSEDTWSDSYDSSDYTSSDLEGAAGGRRSALQEQISQSCQQIISKFDTTSGDNLLNEKEKEDKSGSAIQAPCLGRDTAFVYQKLVQSFTKMAGDGVSSDASSTPHSSPPLIAKVMHHIGSRLVALMHEVSEGGPAVQHHSTSWRRYSQHHRTPSSASTTEDDDSTSDSTNATSSTHLQLPRSKSHDPLLLINNHPSASTGQEGEEREASDYERFSWRGSFESALMAADSRTKLSLLACSGDVSVGASASASALAMAAKRRSAGDLLFNPRSLSREQLDRVRSCGSIGGGSGGGGIGGCGGSIEERIWSNRRRSSVPDANTRGESGDEDTEDELEYGGESRATTLPRGMQSALSAATNSLPRLPASTATTGLTTTSTTSSQMHKAHSVYHFLPQHSGVKSARYRPPGFARNSNVTGAIGGPKRAVSAPGLQVSGSQSSAAKRDNSRSRRQQAISLTPDDGSSLSEACSTPIIGGGSRAASSHTVMDMDDMDPGLHSGHLATRASLSSLGARSDSMASVYSGAGEGRCCRSVVVTGEVEFALQYDYKHLTFEVHVTKCKNLAPVDVKRKRSDPYVKVYLLPDKSKSGKRKTKVKKHTLNPEFNETLKFHMSLSGLETRTLWLTVWHSDMFGRNDFLGEVRMPLENKIFDDPTPRWYPLQERTEPFDDPIAYKGEVIVGLKFVPPDPQQQERELGSDHKGASKSRKNWSRGALHVLVKEARNLQTRAKNSGTCDPFCKSYLLPDKGRSGKQKTGVVRRSGGSPVWGHTFIYKDVSLQELAERGLELTVWDHDRIASNEFLGGVRFNLGTGKHYGKPVDWMDATGRELSLWQSMLERPNFWVEGAVTLRPNLHNHGKNNGS
ncbi:hypothetical protein KPH14_010036 [Odynerus spinipes]|uniref:C2 domain-containing protein n=1 Tax=Odynerus spinipes TaxID=1348599 RepID=A0AAD9RSY0_9HYME|nr:hypothetical protein KPH14_010036 [Odynerus spinipes]